MKSDTFKRQYDILQKIDTELSDLYTTIYPMVDSDDPTKRFYNKVEQTIMYAADIIYRLVKLYEDEDNRRMIGKE